MAISRRGFLGAATAAGLSATATAGAAGAADEPVDAASNTAQFGDPRIPAELTTATSHHFRLADAATAQHDGGTIRQASEDNFPILTGEQASIVFVDLEPGGIREPHWHPSAWEVNIVLSGTATWSVLEPEGHHEQFSASVGDVVFSPQGSLHYFENASSEMLRVAIVFNASTAEGKDDLGMASSISAMPPHVLGALFGVPSDVFARLPRVEKSLAIVRRPSR